MEGTRSELERIAEPVGADIIALGERFRGFLGTDVPLVGKVFDHLLGGGGKRIRPLLVLLTTGLLSGGRRGKGKDEHRENAFRLSAAVEFIHTATLLHDDVVDKSDVRRGQLTAHRAWGVEPSILCGDFFFSRAFSLLVETGCLPLLRTVSDATTAMARGEVLQLLRSYSTGTSEAEYLEVIEGKTARLISACCEGPGQLAGLGAEDLSRLRRIGFSLGMSFQIADDLLDYTAEGKTLGKTPGQDFLEGKVTLPVVYLMEGLPPERRREVIEAFLKERPSQEDFRSLKALMKEAGVFARTREAAEKYARRAEEELAAFPPHPCRRSLAELARYVAGRDH